MTYGSKLLTNPEALGHIPRIYLVMFAHEVSYGQYNLGYLKFK